MIKKIEIPKKIIIMKNSEFQQKQLAKLRSGDKGSYEEASIYTVLMDLCEGNGLDEVFMVLHNLAHDTDQLELLKEKINESESWTWSKSE